MKLLIKEKDFIDMNYIRRLIYFMFGKEAAEILKDIDSDDIYDLMLDKLSDRRANCVNLYIKNLKALEEISIEDKTNKFRVESIISHARSYLLDCSLLADERILLKYVPEIIDESSKNINEECIHKINNYIDKSIEAREKYNKHTSYGTKYYYLTYFIDVLNAYKLRILLNIFKYENSLSSSYDNTPLNKLGLSPVTRYDLSYLGYNTLGDLDFIVSNSSVEEYIKKLRHGKYYNEIKKIIDK